MVNLPILAVPCLNPILSRQACATAQYFLRSVKFMVHIFPQILPPIMLTNFLKSESIDRLIAMQLTNLNILSSHVTKWNSMSFILVCPRFSINVICYLIKYDVHTGGKEKKNVAGYFEW